MSSTITARIVRRFGEDPTTALDLARVLDVPRAVAPGVMVDLSAYGVDQPLRVSGVLLHVIQPWIIGALPAAVDLFLSAEPLAGVEAARATGWEPITA
jgi:hypothetical protein